MPAESTIIETWCTLVKSREGEIGKSESAKTGEEFSTSGDLDLDHRVATILLDTRRNVLPNWGWTAEDKTVVTGRAPRGHTPRDIQLLPVLLFAVDWAATAPGMSWPEAYYVTYVPTCDVRIVTASRDDSTIWGYPDLAIGLCRAIREPEFGTKKVLQSWWRRASGVDACIWEMFLGSGLIDQERADRWGSQVLGRREAF